MGSYLSQSQEVYDVRKIYWDADGNLRYGSSTRQRDDEIIQILQADSNDDTDDSKLWMIIPSRWIRLWLQFAYLKIGDPPDKIDMLSLLVKDPNAPDGWRAKENLKAPILKAMDTADEEENPGHYRRVSLPVWLKLVDLYGSNGGALAVRGMPFNETKRWGYFPNPKVVDINKLQLRPKRGNIDLKKDNTKKGGFFGGFFGGGGGGGKDEAKDPEADALVDKGDKK